MSLPDFDLELPARSTRPSPPRRDGRDPRHGRGHGRPRPGQAGRPRAFRRRLPLAPPGDPGNPTGRRRPLDRRRTSIAALESSALLLEEATPSSTRPNDGHRPDPQPRDGRRNLATAAACADLAPRRRARASVRLRSPPREGRPARRFFRGPVDGPRAGRADHERRGAGSRAGSGSAFVKFGYRRAPRSRRLAAAWVAMTDGKVRDVRIVLERSRRSRSRSAAPRRSSAAAEGRARAACRAAAAECLPISDLRGSQIIGAPSSRSSRARRSSWPPAVRQYSPDSGGAA